MDYMVRPSPSVSSPKLIILRLQDPLSGLRVHGIHYGRPEGIWVYSRPTGYSEVSLNRLEHQNEVRVLECTL